MYTALTIFDIEPFDEKVMDMQESKITFTRSSNVGNENLNSFILEAEADGEIIAEVLCENFHWRVMMGTANGSTVAIAWTDFLKIAHEFSVFVAGESEYLLTHEDETFEDTDNE